MVLRIFQLTFFEHCSLQVAFNETSASDGLLKVNETAREAWHAAVHEVTKSHTT